MSRIDTLIQRSVAFAVASLVTLTLFASIDGLSSRGLDPHALLSQQGSQDSKA